MPSKRINIDDIPFGATALNKKTVGFNGLTRKRQYITAAQARKPTFLYVPNPMGDPEKSLRGWLLTIMRNKPVKPGFEYQNLVPTTRELKFLNKIKRRTNLYFEKQERPNSAAALFRRGGDKIGVLYVLAATHL
jgi:hypothetical protein